jgi:hypothetical protein
MVRLFRGLGMEVSVHVVPTAALLYVQVLLLTMGVRAGVGATRPWPGHGRCAAVVFTVALFSA